MIDAKLVLSVCLMVALVPMPFESGVNLNGARHAGVGAVDAVGGEVQDWCIASVVLDSSGCSEDEAPTILVTWNNGQSCRCPPDCECFGNASVKVTAPSGHGFRPAGATTGCSTKSVTVDLVWSGCGSMDTEGLATRNPTDSCNIVCIFEVVGLCSSCGPL